MSRDASVSFDWADKTYTFRLGIGEIRELQEKCDAGPAFIFRRITDGAWRVDDLVQTIRLGLIGGGMKPIEALKLSREYAEKRPLSESVTPATLILAAALYGAGGEEPLGKSQAAPEEAVLSNEASSGSPPSTAQPD